ncbi:MAG: hypothetical protein GTO46_04850 [Gemmatimonadetes bacterium]|nr:hypothetical protein [Gemmatimonadota bacterium]NIO31034.1 hypothetical protein [Gemmatimonadota bacterium]
MKIELKGWKAIAALAVIVVVLVATFRAERSTLETEAADELKVWIRSEYLARGLHGVDPGQLSEEELEAKGEELLSLSDVQFTSISARGRGDDIIVKVEIQVSGGEPPDGKPVRYFRMSHSTVTGWRVRRETTALSYYLKLF